MKRHIRASSFLLMIILAAMALAATVYAQEDSIEAKSAEMDGLYTGTAERVYTSCLAGDCETCPPVSETVRLTRGGGKVTIVTSGPDNHVGPCRVDAGTTLSWTQTGNYEMTGEGISRFTISDCNKGSFPGSGSGVIEGDKITVSFSCAYGEGSSEKWNNVVLTKQSGGDEDGESADIAEGETGTSDKDDFGQDPDAIREGETEDGITVDRIVGDATVSKDKTYSERVVINTGSRSKVKIRFGDSEIVVGSNSKLRVRTTENKLGQPVIVWEFLNPDAVIYVKDNLHGTRKEESGVVEGDDTKRIFTNLYRSLWIFYNGSYDGKKDLREFYGGETNQPEFMDPGTGERSVIVGIRGTDFYYQAAGGNRTLFLTDGEVDVFTDADDAVAAIGSGDQVSVDAAGKVGAPTAYTSAEIDALATEVSLDEEPAETGEGAFSTTTLAIISAAAGFILAVIVGIALMLRLRKNQ